jgi:hypothetical protein
MFGGGDETPDLGDTGAEGGDLDLGGEEETAEPALDSEGEPEDKLLVAPELPAKRDDDMTTTPRSKGKWYKPVMYRGGDQRASGARKRSYLGHAGNQKSSGSRRNVLGSGAMELFSLSNGVFEQKAKTSDEEEILVVNNEVKVLIENLTKRDEVRKEDETQ